MGRPNCPFCGLLLFHSRWCGPPGCKNGIAGPERLVKRLPAGEPILSFVPDAERRLCRAVMRSQYQLRCSQVQLENRLEALLREAHLKLSSLVSGLLGLSGRCEANTRLIAPRSR